MNYNFKDRIVVDIDRIVQLIPPPCRQKIGISEYYVNNEISKLILNYQRGPVVRLLETHVDQNILRDIQEYRNRENYRDIVLSAVILSNKMGEFRMFKMCMKMSIEFCNQRNLYDHIIIFQNIVAIVNILQADFYNSRTLWENLRNLFFPTIHKLILSIASFMDNNSEFMEDIEWISQDPYILNNYGTLKPYIDILVNKVTLIHQNPIVSGKEFTSWGCWRVF